MPGIFSGHFFGYYFLYGEKRFHEKVPKWKKNVFFFKKIHPQKSKIIEYFSLNSNNN